MPVGVQSNLPKTEEIYVLIEKNPFPLAAAYKLGASAEPNVQTRFKMGQSTNVVVVVRADGKSPRELKETPETEFFLRRDLHRLVILNTSNLLVSLLFGQVFILTF